MKSSENQRCTTIKFQDLVHTWQSSWCTTHVSSRMLTMMPLPTMRLLISSKKIKHKRKLTGRTSKMKLQERNRSLVKNMSQRRKLGLSTAMLTSRPNLLSMLFVLILWDKTGNSPNKKKISLSTASKTTEILGKRSKSQT